MNTIFIRDEMLKIRDKILHILEKDNELYNVLFTDEDNTIDVDYKGESYKLIIEKCNN